MSDIINKINEYLNEGETFTPFQQKLLYDYTNVNANNIRDAKQLARQEMYMWNLGSNKESESELTKQIEDLIKKGYAQIKSGTFSLTDKGKKTDIARNAARQIGSNYGGRPGRYTGD